MLKIENVEIAGFGPALRGMRNPKNSWDRSDSFMCEGLPYGDCKNESDCENADDCCNGFRMGPNDLKLAETLADGGPVHAKYRRMIIVWLDITAPLLWWKQYDTYRWGVEKNSCSTMHKIHAKKFEMEDFSTDGMTDGAKDILYDIIDALNFERENYLETKEKAHWESMVRLLPENYNQRRTVMVSYEALSNMYQWRRNHKVGEWHVFCDWIESLPYSNLITGIRG